MRADDWPFATAAERADYERVERLYGALVATVDPDDPWSHPDASLLDRVSLADWLRSVDASPAVIRCLATGALALADGSIEYTSLLAELRKSAAAGERGLLRLRALGVAAGDAREAPRWRSGWLPRSTAACGSVPWSRRSSVSAARLLGAARGGEELARGPSSARSRSACCATIAIDGVAPERLASLRAQRNALVAKVVAVYERSVWADVGANGLSEGEGVLASTWPQRDGVLSALVPPERLGLLLAVSGGRPGGARPGRARADVRRRRARRASRARAALGHRPFTRGYVTQWWPGDVMRVGPLHGTHDPPFYVCGSDQWVAGYMEGAVRTGRAAAAAALAAGRHGRWVRLQATAAAPAPRPAGRCSVTGGALLVGERRAVVRASSP